MKVIGGVCLLLLGLGLCIGATILTQGPTDSYICLAGLGCLGSLTALGGVGAIIEGFRSEGPFEPPLQM
jgi:hypothetical protein